MKKSAKIYYFTLTDEMPREDKLSWFSHTKFKDIAFDRIEPDKNHNWINLTDNDFDDLLPLANKETKLAKSQKEEQAVFKLFSNGVATNRDEWVYDFSKLNLKEKIKFFIEKYSRCSNDNFDLSIKWSRDLKKELNSGKKVTFTDKKIINSFYRPFIKKYQYGERILNDVLTQNHYDMFGNYLINNNKIIAIDMSKKLFNILSINHLVDLHFNGDSQCLPLYHYDSEGNRHDNITDWGLTQFQTHYQDDTITKENIFHYTYAVLHNPAYRQKYELNLKREFPRLPFYTDFPQWINWGQQLMDLHLNYEQAKKYKLKQIDIETIKLNKPKLKADKEAGKIYLDQITTLQGIPSIAWDYKLGNRSALEWILDQYKEKTPRDPTIAAKFNTYRFADYKLQVIELLQRVCTVSVETMKIIGEMSE